MDYVKLVILREGYSWTGSGMQPGEVFLETTIAKMSQKPVSIPYEPVTHLLRMYQRGKADRCV